MLHRAFDFVADSRHAEWQACGRALRATRGRQSLRDFRPAGSAGSLQSPASVAIDVRRES